jgi:hypothetical protein
MGEEDRPPVPENWRDPNELGPPLLVQLREHRGFVLSALALILFVGITFVAVRPLSGHAPSGSVAPSPSVRGVPFFGLDPGLAYDPMHHQVVLFNYLGETWLWSGNRWTAAHPRVSPHGRGDAAMAWDPKLGEVLLFGGWVVPDDLPPRDTWAWNGSSWRQVGDGAVSPPGGAAGMAYDAIRRQMVLLVVVGRGTTATTETWTWDGARWQRQPQLDGPVGPILAFDGRSRTVLSAGERCTASGCNSETWSWDGAAWQRLAPQHQPGASAHMTLVRDPVSGQLLLLTIANLPHGVQAPTETWTWDGRDWTRLTSVGHPGRIVYAVGASDGSGGLVWAFEDVTPGPGVPRVDVAWEWTGGRWVQLEDAAQ